MTHFSVMVIGDEHEEQLQPFHQFECTGTNDEYVEDVDITDDVLSYMKDNDESLKESLSYFGIEDVVTDESDIDIEDEHEFGYALVDSDNNLIKAVNRTNPNYEWDWWQLGGRWSGHLRLKEGCVGETGEPGLMGSCSNIGPQFCDQAVKGDIDFEGMKNAAGERAAEEWDTAATIINGETWESWENIRDSSDTMDEARERYNSQAAVKRFRDHEEFRWGSPDEFLLSREDYIKAARDNAIVSYAVLMDGEWYSRENEDNWVEKFNELLDSVSDDTVITIVDCHI